MATAESQTSMREISSAETVTKSEYANMLEDNLTVAEELAHLNNNEDERCGHFGKLNADKNANEVQ